MRNKGLTLVELLAALAILGLVIVAVTGFLNTGIKTSSRTNVETNLQREAQTSQNQMTDWIMSANHGIAVYPSCGYYDQAVGIYHDGELDSEKYVQILYYRKDDKKVYYDKRFINESFGGTEIEIQAAADTITTEDAWKKYVFCEYVKEFDLDITNIEKRYVELKMVLKLQDLEYNQDPKKIMLRNKPVTNPTDYK